MSRVKMLQNKRNQKIRETILGLSLALFIGVAGSAGSYAYFSDRVNADNGIKITMGTLDVGIGEGFEITNPKENEEETIDFNITNEGTLDEILTLKFEMKNISCEIDDDLDEIEYKLVDAETKKEIINGNLEELKAGVETNIGRLNAGDSRIYRATIHFEDNIQPSYIKDLGIQFNLIVDGVQINDESVENGGAN